MPEYTTIKISENFYCFEQDFVRSFMFIGEKEALLVDTGIGGDLREETEKLTKLPLTVVFTHGDLDHVGAAGQFERCFMHPSEFDYYQRKNKDTKQMEPIWEGDRIDLGSFCFEIILIPGHTPGSIALLEKRKRFLIGGDSVQTGSIFMMGEGRNFAAFRASMHKLEGLLENFDTIYSSHHELSVKADIIKQLYSGAGKVLKNQVKGKPEKLHDKMIHCFSVDGISFYAE